jgi:hypothetical protein
MVTIGWYAGPARRIAPEPGYFEQPGSRYFRDCAAVARMHADAELLREATIAAESTFEERSMKKPLPEAMFNDAEKSRLTMLRAWVLDNDVTEIEMKERQFWNFAHLQPLAEKPWTTFMGRAISVPDMPLGAQKHLGVFDKRTLGAI